MLDNSHLQKLKKLCITYITLYCISIVIELAFAALLLYLTIKNTTLIIIGGILQNGELLSGTKKAVDVITLLLAIIIGILALVRFIIYTIITALYHKHFDKTSTLILLIIGFFIPIVSLVGSAVVMRETRQSQSDALVETAESEFSQEE